MDFFTSASADSAFDGQRQLKFVVVGSTCINVHQDFVIFEGGGLL